MEMCTLILTLISILLGTYYFLRKRYNIFKEAGIPHKRPLPFVGNLWPKFTGQVSFAEWLHDMYHIHPDAKYVGMYSMMNPIIIIRDPELVKSITIKNFDYFTDRTFITDETYDPLMGKTLVGLRGNRWKEIRATLSPAFTSMKMKTMYRLMSECAVYFAKYLTTLPEDKQILDTKDFFSRYANDIIASCAYGINIDSLKDSENKFFIHGSNVTVLDTITSAKIILNRNLPTIAKMLRLKLVSNDATCFFNDIISDAVKTREKNGINRPDMIQLMMEMRNKMESGNELTIEDMTAQAFMFFSAGFDTSSSTICFIAHEIAVNPDVQQKLHEEIDNFLQENNGDISYEEINNLKYFDAVINEALRMYPVGIIVDRTCVKDFELPPTLPGLKPYIVKAGTEVWVPIHGLHYDPKYYEEPTKFNPNRFYEDPKKYLNSGIFIPFGLGPRMCIGLRFAMMEMKVLLFHILARCEFKPCSKTSVPMKMSTNGINLRPENGFWLKIEPRKNIHSSLTR